MASQFLQPGSPAARSDVNTPSKRGGGGGGVFSLSPFKPRGSPLGSTPSLGGGSSTAPGSPLASDAGTGSPQSTLRQRSLIPSYAHAVQKREIIRAQGEQLAALQATVQQQDVELGRCVCCSVGCCGVLF